MQLDQVREATAHHEAELRSMGVKSLAVFGSTVRSEARPDSDVDLMVKFDRPVGLFHFLRVRRFLESLFADAEIDLVVREAVLNELKEDIYGAAVGVL